MRVEERFLNYIVVNTASDENSNTKPSTQCQLVLAQKLVQELKELGIDNASLDKFGNVFAYIEATEGYENIKPLGFIAHMDTVGAQNVTVKPQIIYNYNGEDIELKGSGKTIFVNMFPHLKALKGRTLITTDGTTILGADDKAGIAEIMTLCEILLSPDSEHGKVCIAFTPDEEIGEGATNFDVEKFGAAYAYTVDGGSEGEFEYENFNAATVKFKINGIDTHPGSAKGVMVNAASIACKIQAMLPSLEVPELTEGYEGFYHLMHISGGVESAEMTYILRHHDVSCFKAQKSCVEHITKVLNEQYGDGCVELVYKEGYKNMAEVINNNKQLVDIAMEAIKKARIEPLVKPIRGGTDGASLSFKGLPCPNLGTGGYAFHGFSEHITVEGMERCVEILKNITDIYFKTNSDN